MMNKEIFWQMIDEAREESGGVMNNCAYTEYESTFCNLLERELARLDDADLIKWQQIFNVYRCQITEHKEKIHAAAHFINGYCSDRGFYYFSNWLVASGKEIYMKAIYDPDDLADIEINGYAVQEELSDVAVRAFNAKRGLHDSDKLFKTIMRLCVPMTDEEKLSITSEITRAPKSAIDDDIYSKGIEVEKWLPKLSAKYNRWWKKMYFTLRDPNEYDRLNLYVNSCIDL